MVAKKILKNTDIDHIPSLYSVLQDFSLFSLITNTSLDTLAALWWIFFFKINQLCKISPLIARKYRSTFSPQSLALQYYRRLHLLYWNFLFKGFLFHLFNNSLGWCSFSQLKILVLFIKTNTAKLLEEVNPKGTPKRETRVNIFVIFAAALSNFRI